MTYVNYFRHSGEKRPKKTRSRSLPSANHGALSALEKIGQFSRCSVFEVAFLTVQHTKSLFKMVQMKEVQITLYRIFTFLF